MLSNPLFWSVVVCALVTMLIRFLPFLVLDNGKPIPKILEYLGKVLPYAVIGMLVVFCLKGISFSSPKGFVPELIAGVLVALLHAWKKNSLLSIVVGTVTYMVLVQAVFK